MFRWLAVTFLLACGCVLAVWLVSETFGGTNPKPGGQPEPSAPRPGGEGDVAREPDKPRDEPAAAPRDDRPVSVQEVKVGPGSAQHLIVPEARILPTDVQNVPNEKDGKLICVATEIKPGEVVPKEKRVDVEFGMLAVLLREGEEVKPEEEVRLEGSRQRYRRPRPNEEFYPGRVVVARQKLVLRKLEPGDTVEKGQLLALVNPEMALDDLAIKVAALDAADADRRATTKTKEEAQKRYESMTRQRRTAARSVSDEEYRGALLAWDRYIFEEVAKGSALKKAQRELSGALTVLKMHEIRASIPGTVKYLNKYMGDAVKNLETVMQIQNPDLLRVEGRVEVQDAWRLHLRLDQAHQLRKRGKLLLDEATARGDKARQDEAGKLLAKASALLRVIVEPTRPEAPVAVLKGHLYEVTCVAVSKGANPVIASGSEDGTVRIWGRAGKGQPWEQRYRLGHHAVVRAVACTPKDARRNLLVTGTVTGQGRIFDLDNLKGGERLLEGRHARAITCASFSPDGTLVATGGDDNDVRIWDVETGRLKHHIRAHRAPVTSVQWADRDRLVSAGRDNRLVVWSVAEGKAPVEATDPFTRRSGEVPQLGVSPDGKHVLFDVDREVRVLSLDSQRMEGVLRNPQGAGNFSTLALFAPDGNTILTAGAGPLQLWRAPTEKARAAELRQFVWTSGSATCAAFAPDSSFAVTGTREDHQVLVWEMPSSAETQDVVHADLAFVETILDNSTRRVPVRAELKRPPWMMPGSTATIVIPPPPADAAR